MDFYAEQIVTKTKTVKEYLLAALILLAAVVLCYASLIFLRALSTVAALVIVLAGWGAWKLIQMLNIEYEYEIINNYIDVDKIMGRARRKKVITIDLNRAELCTYTDADEFKRKAGIQKVYDLSGNPNAEGRVFVDFADDKNQKVRVILRPNDKIKDMLKKVAPKIVKL